MPDVVMRATPVDSDISLFSATTTGLVAEIQRRHDMSPTVAAAVGRLATAAVLLGATLTGSERLSLQISGDGPIGALTAEAWLLDDVTVGARGYARNRHAELPIDSRGKFAVGKAVGQGMLQVTKSYDVGQPYVGVVPLHSGEIAEDLAAYLVHSEQIPSVVALGVLAGPRGIIAAGGIVAQMLPGSDDAARARLEQRANAMPAVTTAMAEGADARALLTQLAEGEIRSHQTMNVRFACLCTRQKVETALLGLGADELANMKAERDEAEATCEFCGQVYRLTGAELQRLIDRLETAKRG